MKDFVLSFVFGVISGLILFSVAAASPALPSRPDETKAKPAIANGVFVNGVN